MQDGEAYEVVTPPVYLAPVNIRYNSITLEDGTGFKKCPVFYKDDIIKCLEHNPNADRFDIIVNPNEEKAVVSAIYDI